MCVLCCVGCDVCDAMLCADVCAMLCGLRCVGCDVWAAQRKEPLQGGFCEAQLEMTGNEISGDLNYMV